MITDLYQHPVFQQERRDKQALQRRNAYLEDTLRRYLNRDLQTRDLEPLHPHAPGVLTPAPGALLTIHFDALRYRANLLHQRRDPVFRVRHMDDVWHCHEILTGPGRMAEDYDKPLPERRSAVGVFQTAHPIEVVR